MNWRPTKLCIDAVLPKVEAGTIGIKKKNNSDRMVEQNTNLQLRGGCREKDYKKIYVKTKSFQILFLSLANALLFRQSFFFCFYFFFIRTKYLSNRLKLYQLMASENTREKRKQGGKLTKQWKYIVDRVVSMLTNTSRHSHIYFRPDSGGWGKRKNTNARKTERKRKIEWSKRKNSIVGDKSYQREWVCG